ncbi:MAG TPA: NAD+ synthase, partial [Candidatus Omnitrophota bacterium]|nr:NAD+ synthase [Candidatus Omnitrophota bacterium]
MSDVLSIALAQINPVVGDVAGNVARIRAARTQAATDGAQLVVFPELTLSGYPPEDLVLKDAFLDAVEMAVEELARDTADEGPALLVGAPWRVDGKRHNAVLLLDHGKVTATRLKHHLPNYGVFDEARVFVPGPAPGPIAFRGVRLGVMVCEDMWFSDVAETLAETGAEILVVPNGSPFELDKHDVRLNRAVARVVETGLPLLYVNQLGGQDELVFDGASFALDAKGKPLVRLNPWRVEVVTTTWRRTAEGWTTDGPLAPEPSRSESVYQAMMLGLRDYVTKNGFPGVVLGLSGGIDSALAAAVAADALGPDKVWCVMMPSPYTSRESLEDAAAVAEMLGCRLDSIGIQPAMGAFDGMLAPVFQGKDSDITEENLQSRARGITLMAISNKFGPMVLSTGNK